LRPDCGAARQFGPISALRLPKKYAAIRPLSKENPMKLFVAAALIMACGASAALAGPIEDRQELMKGVQAATKDAVALSRGAYDPAKAKTVTQVYVDAAAKIPTLFPKGTETGSKTTADAKIWSDPAGFKAAAMKFGEDAKAAQATTDQASFNAAFINITKDCGACHGSYRTKPQ
jgi:cytochrome c556